VGRVYSVPIQLTAVTTQVDLWDIAPADDKPIKLHAVYLGQSTELGDTAEEQLGIQIIRGFATVGSGGSSATPTPVGNSIDTAAGATVRVLDTTVAVVGGGSTTHLHADTWNVRAPYQVIWTPEMRPGCSQADTRIIIRTTGAPADSVTIAGTCYFEELG
jgi:hypothetical protein